MLPSAHVLVEIAARTAVIYGVVLIGVRISGKREVGQMTPFDLTLLLLISNAVQNAMTGPGHFADRRCYRREHTADSQLCCRGTLGRQSALPQVCPRSAQPFSSRWTSHQRAHG